MTRHKMVKKKLKMNKNINSDVEDKAIRQSINDKKHKTNNITNIVFVSTFPPKV